MMPKFFSLSAMRGVTLAAILCLGGTVAALPEMAQARGPESVADVAEGLLDDGLEGGFRGGEIALGQFPEVVTLDHGGKIQLRRRRARSGSGRRRTRAPTRRPRSGSPSR